MQVAIDNTSGPFAVTQPNSAMTLDTAQQQVIEWNVACTDAGSVSCATVDIAISTSLSAAMFCTLTSVLPIWDSIPTGKKWLMSSLKEKQMRLPVSRLR